MNQCTKLFYQFLCITSDIIIYIFIIDPVGPMIQIICIIRSDIYYGGMTLKALKSLSLTVYLSTCILYLAMHFVSSYNFSSLINNYSDRPLDVGIIHPINMYDISHGTCSRMSMTLNRIKV